MVKVRESNTRFPVSQPFWKKTTPVSFEWPAAAPGDIKRGIPTVELVAAGAATAAIGYERKLRIRNQLRNSPILKVEAGSRRVIPPGDSLGLTDERQQVEPEVVIEADLRLLLQDSCPAPPARRNSGIQSADAWLAE